MNAKTIKKAIVNDFTELSNHFVEKGFLKITKKVNGKDKFYSIQVNKIKDLKELYDVLSKISDRTD
jgi:hypothetical protein